GKGGASRQPSGQGSPQSATPAGQGTQGKGPPPRPATVQARRPGRMPPKPKLSKAALEGAAPLRTFSELKAFFEAQQPEPEPPRPKLAEETPPPPEAKPPET